MVYKFVPGDVVVLKSGGPPMTIDETPNPDRGYNEDKYHVVWFKGASSESAYYGEHTLQAYTPPAK